MPFILMGSRLPLASPRVKVALTMLSTHAGTSSRKALADLMWRGTQSPGLDAST